MECSLILVRYNKFVIKKKIVYNLNMQISF